MQKGETNAQDKTKTKTVLLGITVYTYYVLYYVKHNYNNLYFNYTKKKPYYYAENTEYFTLRSL